MKSKHRTAANRVRRRYGSTAENVERVLAAQDGPCATCREAPADQVDPCHRTDQVRGLLCSCNGALGQFRDRPELMPNAISYPGGGG